ncbi:hypothetical protein VOLCADRAFT_119338 [Volvox carteri f. nagariensis]|uniref:Uncharacterized protein n=1 Tax=Volvox carteri f. nagariensis TaxID=3068 RepID=D8UCA6_VOLCA|nr:uncharacterized protein VOLCADRAFT_119338 [Volvox carteri f. nagariensis]EFJ42664.1 hypothetical protein VOLCADRAFT_119338 [Volvox carteri f. nagariensis]|eukprot:XP_002956315.1 hypothetical protein VOLCADRAFT_119338 [Volvox carteri f. nagariensis]
MCFKPKDVPSKKVVLVELERAKVGLEQENSVLKLKLKDLQASAARAAKERDGLSYQRAELESQLQQRSSHASHVLTQVTCLRTNLTSKLQDFLEQHLAGQVVPAQDCKATHGSAAASATHRVNVHIVQPEYVGDEEELCSGQAAAAGNEDAAAAAMLPSKISDSAPTQIQSAASQSQPTVENTGDKTAVGPDVPLSVQERLDRELEALACAHQRVLDQATRLCEALRQAEVDKAELRTNVACARRRLEQAEANAADQQQVLQLRCAALEQENEQLTGMNQEMQQRFEGAQGELSLAKKQWTSDGAQLAKQAAELEATNGRLREAEAEIRALQSQLAAATEQAQDAIAKVGELQQQVTARASSLDEAGSVLAARESELAEATTELQQLRTRLTEQEQAREALTREVQDLTGLGKQTTDKLEEAHSKLTDTQCQLGEVQRELSEAQRELAAANQQLTAQTQALADANAQLQALADTQRQLVDTQRELATVERELAAAEQQLEVKAQALADSGTQLQALADTQRELSAAQRELSAARQQIAAQAQALVDSNAQLQESRAALAATGERLNRALEEVAASESRVAEANTQYLNTKQSVISTAKQLASMAKDHSTNLAKLHALEAEATSLREQLAAARSAEASLRVQAETSSAAARDAREAAETSGAEARRLRVAYDTASADLRRKIMLLTAIARMADKGQAGAGGARGRDVQAPDPADGYGAVTSEQRLRLKICESPLPLLGALTAGIMDSSRLRHLALDMDTSREVTWEKAGLRICCLAAAIGLNNSLQTLQLGGWTWGELGNGTALPFLALGGGGGGGGGGMLRSVQLATNLFDLEAAAMLKDLLAAGLVELDTGGGRMVEEEGGAGAGGQRSNGGVSAGAGQQGVLYLYSGNERLDGWYREMLLLANRLRPQSRTSSSGGGSRTSLPAAVTATAPVLQSASNGGGGAAAAATAGAPFVHSLSAPSIALSFASAMTDDVRGQPTSSAGSSTAPASISNGPTAAAAAAVDCDLSSEALESHHMVLVMTVLLTCPGMKRLRLDGNKLGDGGVALLALGLASNTGLRELYLSRNGIRAAGAHSLARCLEAANSTLLRLDLSGQRLEGIGAAGAEAMAQALRTNRTMEDLNLSSCGLTGSAAACFAGAIRAAGAIRPQALSAGGAAAPAASSPGVSPRGGSGAGGGGGGGCLRRLALSGNGIDAATSKALLAAAAERPGLVLTL